MVLNGNRRFGMFEEMPINELDQYFMVKKQH